MKAERLIFDIETAPAPAKIELLTDKFDPASVKVGNIKDPDKIKEKQNEAEKAYYKQIEDKAALHAETAQVLCIGVYEDKGVAGGNTFILDADECGEDSVIYKFWSLLGDALMSQVEVCGFNIKGFDLPFLLRRSFHLGIAPPLFIYEHGKRRWHSKVIDLMEIYASGEWGYRISLDRVCRSLDIGGKFTGGVEGKNFHKAWRSKDPERRKNAKEYLLRDIGLTGGLASRLLGYLRSECEALRAS